MSTVLVNSGLWELFFQPVLSPRLVKWVQDFAPEVVYCQGYNLAFAWLPVMIHRTLGVPVCFHTGDDWPKDLYSSSPFRAVLRPPVRRAARELVMAASSRLSNGDAMSREFHRRYGVDFEPIMMCDDPRRFSRAPIRRVADECRVSLVYAGALNSQRCGPVLDLCGAAEELRTAGLDVQVTALASGVAPEFAQILSRSSVLNILPAPSHEELPSYLRGADILLLPESFNPKHANTNRLAVSSKSHLYMMSERPVLVYAPSETGVAEYAKREGWACLVETEGKAPLAGALLKLATDEVLQEKLVARGVEVARQNHDEAVIREKIRRALSSAAFIDDRAGGSAIPPHATERGPTD